MGCLILLVGLLGAPSTTAHSPNTEGFLTDWCVGAFSNTAPGGGRIEDSSVELTCGQCSIATNRACKVNSDCPAAQTCVNLTSKTETAWWDNRTDGAVNDLGTIVTTYDNTNLYFGAELWVDPDPVSLPFAEIALDVGPGGIGTWHDPARKMVAPGTCSTFTDRACTSNADCHFCKLSTESFPSTRVRSCGSACDPDIGDVCETDQTCEGLGTVPIMNVGQFSTPASEADYLLVFDFSFWLIGANDGKATRLMKAVDGAWVPVADFAPGFNPGASGGSGGPPGSVEVAIPWSAFGCTGCPDACDCPDFGPGDPFRFTMVIARGTLTLDFNPDGAVEDVMSETVAGVNTTSANSCPGFGIVTTNCEIGDGSVDSYIPPADPAEIPGGRIEADSLRASSDGGESLTLSWNPSCASADNDYEVYEGTLGIWNDHVPVPGLCTTGGATTATFDSSAGSHYYLIVPTDGSIEGSYGEDSDGFERPASSSACWTQRLGLCP